MLPERVLNFLFSRKLSIREALSGVDAADTITDRSKAF
jgi:hypothetical protein